MARYLRKFYCNEKPLHFEFKRHDDNIVDHVAGESVDHIIVEIENSIRGLYWRMIVNGEVGPVSSYYQGIYEFKGYCLTTEYWGDDKTTFQPFVPFRPNFAQPHPTYAPEGNKG